MTRVEFIEIGTGRWKWQFVHEAGAVLATSHMEFHSYTACKKSYDRMAQSIALGVSEKIVGK